MTVICHLRTAVTALALLSIEATAEEPLTTRCESGPLMAAFAGFFGTGRMPQDLSRFLGDVALNKIEPYKAFDKRLLRRHLLGLSPAPHIFPGARAD
jgi:hypothetical protein